MTIPSLTLEQNEKQRRKLDEQDAPISPIITQPAPPTAEYFGLWRDKSGASWDERIPRPDLAKLYVGKFNSARVLLLDGESGQGKTWLLHDLRDEFAKRLPGSDHRYLECEAGVTPDSINTNISEVMKPLGEPNFYQAPFNPTGICSALEKSGKVHYLYLDDVDKQMIAGQFPEILEVIIRDILPSTNKLRLILIGKSADMLRKAVSDLDQEAYVMEHPNGGNYNGFEDDETQDVKLWLQSKLSKKSQFLIDQILDYTPPPASSRREIPKVYLRFPVYLDALVEYAKGKDLTAVPTISQVLEGSVEKRFKNIPNQDQRKECKNICEVLSCLTQYENPNEVRPALLSVYNTRYGASLNTKGLDEYLRALMGGIIHTPLTADGVFFHHDVIRDFMYKIIETQRGEIHGQIAEYYEKQSKASSISEKKRDEYDEYRIWHLARSDKPSEETGELLKRLGRSKQRAGMYADEIRLRESMRGKLGKNILEWTNLANLAEAYYNAAPDSEREIELLGGMIENPLTMATLKDEAFDVYIQVRSAEAIQKYEDGKIPEATEIARLVCAEIYDEKIKPDPALLSNSLINLGICYYKQMRYTESDTIKDNFPNILINGTMYSGTKIPTTVKECFNTAQDLLDTMRKNLRRQKLQGFDDAYTKDYVRNLINGCHATRCAIPKETNSDTVSDRKDEEDLAELLNLTLAKVDPNTQEKRVELYTQEVLYGCLQLATYALWDGNYNKAEEWIKATENADAERAKYINEQRIYGIADMSNTTDPWASSYIFLLRGYLYLFRNKDFVLARECFNKALQEFIEQQYKRDTLFAQYAITISFIWEDYVRSQQTISSPTRLTDDVVLSLRNLIFHRLYDHRRTAQKIGEKIGLAAIIYVEKWYQEQTKATDTQFPILKLDAVNKDLLYNDDGKQRINTLFSGILDVLPTNNSTLKGLPPMIAAMLVFMSSPALPTANEVEQLKNIATTATINESEAHIS